MNPASEGGNDRGRLPARQGRGAGISPPNRFVAARQAPDFTDLGAEDLEALQADRQTRFLPDNSKSIVSENNSPDVPFRYSLNPYRGCEHGCAYCYARNTHEYLGFNAGLDFESRILVKHDAAALFRAFLARDGWKPEEIAFSGVTDCYQPAERQYRLTRQCLEVALEFRQPVGIVTKNALICRDLDLLRELAALRLVHANISVTTLDAGLAGRLEPRTSRPLARLRAIELLAATGVPTRIMLAPVIPGLNDEEIPALLAAGKQAGAQSAAYILLRLPLAVEPIFLDWLARHLPSRAARIESLIRQSRAGALSSSGWGTRMRGSGRLAEQIERIFQVFRRRLLLDRPLPAHDFTQFRRPGPGERQLKLFDAP